MKKIFLILFGISIILVGVIFVLYKNNESKNDEVVDIFKDEEIIEDNTESIDEENVVIKKTNKVIVDIKGMVASPGVYEVDSSARVNDQTCTIMIQKLRPLFARNLLISKGI